MKTLESHRGNGRNEYPVRPVWNSIIAGIVLGHETIESLRRELQRNPAVCELCGFNIFALPEAVPPAWVYSRFLKLLIRHNLEVSKLFNNLVKQSMLEFPGFGRQLALDGKAIESHARRNGKLAGDGRGDMDADWGRHVYSGIDSNGRIWESIKKWFGYKLHLIIDSEYELPVAFTLTRASVNEMPVAHKLLENLNKKHPVLIEKTEYLSADKGLDDGKLVKRLWDEWKIKPIIDIRNQWKDLDSTKVLPGYENVLYNYRGIVTCMCPKQNKIRTMAYGGFESDRNTLKYRCPAAHYGYVCEGRQKCKVGSGIRVPLDVDRRIFTPVARSSYKWKRLYKKRTAVERVNSRLDTSFGFEHHTMRGSKKVSLKLCLAFSIMLAIAVGWKKEDHPELVRSMCRTA